MTVIGFVTLMFQVDYRDLTSCLGERAPIVIFKNCFAIYVETFESPEFFSSVLDLVTSV